MRLNNEPARTVPSLDEDLWNLQLNPDLDLSERVTGMEDSNNDSDEFVDRHEESPGPPAETSREF